MTEPTPAALPTNPGERPSRLRRALAWIKARETRQRIVRFLYGDRPVVALFVYSPTLLAMALDVVVRPKALLALSWGMKAVYLGSALAGAGIWGPIFWFASRLFLVEGRRRPLARAALALLFVVGFAPFAAMAYGGQVFHYHVFHGYMSRDSVRLGWRIRHALGDLFAGWGLAIAGAGVAALIITAGVALLVKRAARPLRAASPVIPIISLVGSLVCYSIDFIETRALQAAPPDACFLHGEVYAVKMAVLHPDRAAEGLGPRLPDPLPTLAKAAHRPNVIVVLSESVRADAMCSRKETGCEAPFLDQAAPDRVALGDLTTQASGTVVACMILWTGLPPEVDAVTAHKAPTLWELAHAVGYRTAYVGSQHISYEGMGVFLSHAGIDRMVSALELGDAPHVFVGAPDEYATARALKFVKEEVPAGDPYFLLVHFSNTHWDYRVDPSLQPYSPHSSDPMDGLQHLKNHYRNSVRLQERTLSTFLSDLKATPGWDDTVVIFLSDHGEQFREHKRLYHINNIFDEEVRIPGFLVAGKNALGAEQQAALGTFRGYRTYSQDVHATVEDLFGIYDQRAGLPAASLTQGRSLLRPRPTEEPVMSLSTTSEVSEADDPQYGVRRGQELLVGSESRAFQCFESDMDPGQHHALPASRCPGLEPIAKKRFPIVKGAK